MCNLQLEYVQLQFTATASLCLSLLKSQVPGIFASVKVFCITAMPSIYPLQTEHALQRKKPKQKPNKRYKSTTVLQPPYCVASDIVFTTHFRFDTLQKILSVLSHIL